MMALWLDSLPMQGGVIQERALAMSVRKEPDGRWRYRKTVRLPDGTKERISGTPKNDNTRIAAEEAERAHVHRLLHPAPVIAAPEKREVPTLATFATKFMDGLAVKLRDASIRTIATQFKHHILPHLGHLPIDAVTYGVIQDWKIALVKTPLIRRKYVADRAPKTLSAKWVNYCMASLHACLKDARKRGIIDVVPEFEWLRTRQAERYFLSFEEAERLIDAADGEWRTMILVGCKTGMRQGELMALRWEDVDLGAGRIVVRRSAYKSLAGAWLVGATKNGKTREIALGDRVRAALQAHRHERGPFVFCTADGRMFRRNETYAPLARAIKRAGLRPFGWHTLRHTFASHLVMRGVALKAVQELLGHATILMTQRYAHLAPDVVRDAVRMLDLPPTDATSSKILTNPPSLAS
jgi:integrase